MRLVWELEVSKLGYHKARLGIAGRQDLALLKEVEYVQGCGSDYEGGGQAGGVWCESELNRAKAGVEDTDHAWTWPDSC